VVRYFNVCGLRLDNIEAGRVITWFRKESGSRPALTSASMEERRSP